MSAATDFRVSLDFFDHPKTMRLEASAGERGVLALLRLWGWAGKHRSNGELTGLTNREIASAARWKGKADALLESLVLTGWIDRSGERLFLHDWADWQGWVCSGAARSRSARIASMTKRCMLTGMSADAYLDAQGGEIAEDEDLRSALRAALVRASERSAQRTPKRTTGGVRNESVAESPSPSPTPTPTHNEGEEESAPPPDLPASGSAASPPVAESKPTPPRCARCRDTRRITQPLRRPTTDPSPPAIGSMFIPCPDCAGARCREPQPAESAPEAPKRGYTLPPHVQPCPSPRPSWRVVGPPAGRRRRRFDRNQDDDA